MIESKRAWFTSEEVERSENAVIDLKSNDWKPRKWLSDDGAGALANQLEEALKVAKELECKYLSEDQDVCLTCEIQERLEDVVRVLRGEDK